MPNAPKTVILRARVDQPLYDALLCSARAQGLPVADLVRATLTAAHYRRAQLCGLLALPRDASDADLFAQLQHEMITLSPSEQLATRRLSTVEQACCYTAMRAANKRKHAKPAPSPATKPLPAGTNAVPKHRALRMHAGASR